MNFKIGTEIIYRDTDGINTIIKSGTITRIGKDTVWLNNKHKPEDQVYSAFLYPNTEECKAFLQRGIDMSTRHKLEEAEYMTETYKLNNDLVRKGLK